MKTKRTSIFQINRMIIFNGFDMRSFAGTPCILSPTIIDLLKIMLYTYKLSLNAHSTYFTKWKVYRIIFIIASCKNLTCPLKYFDDLQMDI